MANSIWYKSFTVALNTTNFDVKAQYPALWTTVPNPKQLKIKTTTDIIIRVNDIANDPIEIKSTDNYFEMALKEITNIYITTTTAATIGLSLIW